MSELGTPVTPPSVAHETSSEAAPVSLQGLPHPLLGTEAEGVIRQTMRAVPGFLARTVGFGLATAVVVSPIVGEKTIQETTFPDYLGTMPVEVGISHNNKSTLDTGVGGKVYLDVTGPDGFGVIARSQGPPEADGTLASYVDPTFVKQNAQLIDSPEKVAKTYVSELRSQLTDNFIRYELLLGLAGGVVLAGVTQRGRANVQQENVKRRIARTGTAILAATAVSGAYALHEFSSWSDEQAIGITYPMSGTSKVSFSTPEMRELAVQVMPFIEKNQERTAEEAKAYEQTAAYSFQAELARQLSQISPREGERLVIAEGDPQGSFVGTKVRANMYQMLLDSLGPDSVALRTISGDISSNGTVAEASFIKAEGGASPGIPVAAIGGDHDSEAATWEQLHENDMLNPDFETVKVNGFSVSGANDREHKTLFGGMVTNDSGISEQELGEKLREKVSDDPQIVLLHQPDAVAGYVGVDSYDDIADLPQSYTLPFDDGIANIAPGSIEIGHTHDFAGPWVLWNTDDENHVTWTLVDQLATSGGYDEHPTINHFSTPFSAPLKDLGVRYVYYNAESGLPTGFVTVKWDTSGHCTIENRVDVGLPDGQPMDLSSAGKGSNERFKATATVRKGKLISYQEHVSSQ